MHHLGLRGEGPVYGAAAIAAAGLVAHLVVSDFGLVPAIPTVPDVPSALPIDVARVQPIGSPPPAPSVLRRAHSLGVHTPVVGTRTPRPSSPAGSPGPFAPGPLGPPTLAPTPTPLPSDDADPSTSPSRANGVDPKPDIGSDPQRPMGPVTGPKQK